MYLLSGPYNIVFCFFDIGSSVTFGGRVKLQKLTLTRTSGMKTSRRGAQRYLELCSVAYRAHFRPDLVLWIWVETDQFLRKRPLTYGSDWSRLNNDDSAGHMQAASRVAKIALSDARQLLRGGSCWLRPIKNRPHGMDVSFSAQPLVTLLSSSSEIYDQAGSEVECVTQKADWPERACILALPRMVTPA